jgi:UDP-N-acetylmuramate--alanine ligase
MLWPSIAVMTNIDYEHMESYGSFAELQQAFVDFANKVPFYGSVVACADDPHLAAVLPRVTRRLVTYGFDAAAGPLRGTGASVMEHLAGSAVEIGSFGARCSVRRQRGDAVDHLGVLELAVPGRHNLQNAMAAVAVALQLGVRFDLAAEALAGFEGAERRFERHGEVNGVLVIDDYAHHPTEIAAVLAAARASLGRRLVVAFQPHRYTRTHALMDAFGPSLKDADEIVVTDVYAAGEDEIAGVTVDALADSIRRGSGRPVRVARALDDVVTQLLSLVKPGDAVISLGAGSIGTVPKRLIEALGRRGARN